MSLDISTVIHVNIYTVFRNALTNYFWDGKECTKTIKQACERYATGEYLNKDLNRLQVISLFNDYISEVRQNAKKIYLSEKERSLKGYSFKDFCKEYDLPFKRVADMQKFVNDNFDTI